MGRARNCRGGINALARTGTILSSYLRNRNSNVPPITSDSVIGEYIIYIKAIWVIDQVGLQVGLRALNDRVRMNFMCEKPTKAII